MTSVVADVKGLGINGEPLQVALGFGWVRQVSLGKVSQGTSKRWRKIGGRTSSLICRYM